jgi:single-strand DNA-binding protein
MAGLNKAMIIGHLGADPELRETQGGKAVCNMRIATSSTYTKADGERVEQTEWHSVVCFNKTAEIAAQYLSKGRQVFVEGRLQTREYEDKDGIKRRSTEIVADVVTFLGGGGKGDDAHGERGGAQERRPTGGKGQGKPASDRSQGARQQRSKPPEDEYYQSGGDDDDIPFE